MKVAVLGCGPAGLLACHAAKLLGHGVDIYSRKERSQIQGAQYIHQAIPELCSEADAVPVGYTKMGTAHGYAAKVYLDPEHPTSWDTFPAGEVQAWPMQGVYSMLWSRYEDRIFDRNLTPARVRYAVEQTDYDIVFCTIPRPLTCEHTVHGPDEIAHNFNSARVVFEPEAKADMENFVLYNGRMSEDWYRTSRLFGHPWTEYSASLFVGEPIPQGWLSGHKPTTTDCNCLNGHKKLVRLGRFGQWSKAVLVTDAFNDAVDALTVDSQPWQSGSPVKRSGEGSGLGDGNWR